MIAQESLQLVEEVWKHRCAGLRARSCMAHAWLMQQICMNMHASGTRSEHPVDCVEVDESQDASAACARSISCAPIGLRDVIISMKTSKR